MIEVDLTQFGYDGIYAEVLYQCDDEVGKSLITMFLIRKDENGDPSDITLVQKSQYITGDRTEVRGNIVRLVEYMCREKIIESYIKVKA
jgi:hypothetical protein